MIVAIWFAALAAGTNSARTLPGRQLEIETVRNLSFARNDRRVRLRRIAGTTALFFQSKLSCDVDGSPNAYHPLDDRLSLDTIDSADGHRVDGAPSGPLDVLPSPEIVVYVNGKPYLQPTGEFAGFYVSETSYQNRSLPAIDPTRYLDARHAQYIVLPGGLVPEAKLGDLAIVYDPATHAHADAIFGDIGPSNESGEAALATLQRLGMRAVDGKSSPGQCRDDLFFLVFPQTSAQLEAADGWPHAQATIDGLAEAEFAKWGGPARIEAILKQDPQGGSVPDDSANSALYDELAFFRGRPGVDRYEFELPARLGGAADGRLPCAPELVIACRTAISACMRTIEAAERGRAPATSAIDLDAHLVRLATAFHRFPVETVDEIGPTERELARISALRDRIRRLARS